MFTSLSGWLDHLWPFCGGSPCLTRRQQRVHTTQIESLENRDLLSAISGMPGVEAHQAVEVGGLEQSAAPEGLPVHGAGHSLKIGHLNQQKLAQAKQAAPVTDYSGHWLLGVNDDQPSDLFELNVQQVGRKVVATITVGDGNETQATLRGRVTDAQLFGRFKLVGGPSRGVMVVTKLASNIFQGTMSVKHPGQPLVIVTLVGMK